MKLQITSSRVSDYQRLPSSEQKALAQLLSFAEISIIPETIAAVSCSVSGIDRQADWPIAAIHQLAEGASQSDAYWMQIHPVHLVLQRDYFSLYPFELTLVTPEECASLLTLLNQHFKPDGFEFSLAKQVIGNEDGFYLRLQQPPEITTTSPELVVGKDIRPYMPQGKGATKWHGILNEVQMLLHDHPINQLRERKGLVPINSIWLSGGGVVQLASKVAQNIYGDSQLARGIAKMNGNSLSALPADIDHWLKAAQDDVIWIIDDISSIGGASFIKMLSLLRRRRIHDLVLYFGLQGHVLHAQIKSSDTWRIWRKRQPLSTYFNGDIHD
ncbi:hypothetical protein A7981_10575 [Methylovorus sp. MM2]|uniref:hypothetical protein n=1 Tax=Methylovorus sp. MM2 TaxID=1848038 RepID=UPI0007E22064|nr:hypothetical protein [Methylovorus sp. MM2]OAM51179.1 hypothetical protein A7981_10575 [Methylovorus sp. MM2]